MSLLSAFTFNKNECNIHVHMILLVFPKSWNGEICNIIDQVMQIGLVLSNKIDIYFKNCLLKLKSYLEVEKYISFANGKQLDFDGKWGAMINSLQFWMPVINISITRMSKWFKLNLTPYSWARQILQVEHLFIKCY